MTKLAIKFTH